MFLIESLRRCLRRSHPHLKWEIIPHLELVVAQEGRVRIYVERPRQTPCHTWLSTLCVDGARVANATGATPGAAVDAACSSWRRLKGWPVSSSVEGAQ